MKQRVAYRVRVPGYQGVAGILFPFTTKDRFLEQATDVKAFYPTSANG